MSILSQVLCTHDLALSSCPLRHPDRSNYQNKNTRERTTYSTVPPSLQYLSFFTSFQTPSFLRFVRSTDLHGASPGTPTVGTRGTGGCEEKEKEGPLLFTSAIAMHACIRSTCTVTIWKQILARWDHGYGWQLGMDLEEPASDSRAGTVRAEKMVDGGWASVVACTRVGTLHVG